MALDIECGLHRYVLPLKNYFKAIYHGFHLAVRILVLLAEKQIQYQCFFYMMVSVTHRIGGDYNGGAYSKACRGRDTFKQTPVYGTFSVYDRHRNYRIQ